MAESKVSRRYAQALLELCDETKNHLAVDKQLQTFVRAFTASAELRDVLRNPVLDADAKKRVITNAFRKAMFAPVTRNFLNVLIDQERIGEIVGIHQQFKSMLASRTRVLEATLRSATPLRPADATAIQKELARITGRNVKVTTEVDASLMGGVVVQVGNVLLDGSLRTDLDMLREQLMGA